MSLLQQSTKDENKKFIFKYLLHNRVFSLETEQIDYFSDYDNRTENILFSLIIIDFKHDLKPHILKRTHLNAETAQIGNNVIIT